MPRIPLLLAALATALAVAPAAQAQNLLDKVEKRVKSALERTAPAPSSPAPAAEPDRVEPADPPVDELPPPAPGAEASADAAPQPGYLGVVLEDIPDGGIRVVELAKDSPAARSGLKVGDKITAVNNAAVKDIEELGTLMEPVRPGGKLSLTVDRDGEETTIEATLGQPPAEPPAREGDAIELGPALGPGDSEVPPPATGDTRREADGPGPASLGVSVITFTDELRQRSDVPARSGAMISTIRPESAAAQAGLPRGGVIVAFDGQRIDTAEELVEAIRASQPGQEVELSYYDRNRLQRKSVTLTAAADPRLLGPGYGGLRGRPLLGRVERAMEGLARPGAAGAVPPADLGAPAAPAELIALREEIALLRAKVETLESRLADVEAKLGPPRAAPDVGGLPDAEAPPADSAPPLRPRTPRNPAGEKVGDD